MNLNKRENPVAPLSHVEQPVEHVELLPTLQRACSEAEADLSFMDIETCTIRALDTTTTKLTTTIHFLNIIFT